MNSALHVLIVEDDADVAMACEQALQLEGFECGCISSAELALKHLSAEFAGVVISDIRLPRKSGLELLADIRIMDAELPVILITGHGDISMAVQAMKDGATDFLEKPFAPERLIKATRRALERRRHVVEARIREENKQTAAAQDLPLLGQSSAIGLLRRTLQGLAGSEADVLVQGETGSGKTLVARCLHEASPRSSGNFVVLDSSGFGDSIDQCLERIVQAHGGTLLITDIENMPLSMQVPLLRVLQERVLIRPGSGDVVVVDCRVIATSHADLLTLSRQGLFRPELYYRLSLVTVNLPPLRERKEDIAPLFQHFAKQSAQNLQRPAPELTLERLQVLLAHDWPGNVRELRQLADALTQGLEISLGNEAAPQE
ncbi:MAG: sigma-54 dependent transcriptional regulator [Comamonas sp.]|jgi:two-component system C4-dicarboxylate transport response regulator DctD|nr:sigma-54 dependent transcriptional regulator [Comamonas sp.]